MIVEYMRYQIADDETDPFECATEPFGVLGPRQADILREALEGDLA
jgi:hypothetical protein